MARFSIVITNFNQKHFIRAAVESALAQPEALREVIVVDDGSSDGSSEILKEYANSIRLCQFPTNRGAIEARNHGAAVATSEYLVFLDGDDILAPWALETYERLVEARNPSLLLAQMVWFAGNVPEPKRETRARIEFVEYDALMHKDRTVGLFASSVIVKRRVFEEAGAWTPGIFHLDVQDFLSKVGYSGPAALMCSPATVFYRVHSSNSIHQFLPFMKMQHRLLAKERNGEYPGGPSRRFERRAWLGGHVAFCTKKGFSAGLYREAFQLIGDGWEMILAAVFRRFLLRITGHAAVQMLDYPQAAVPAARGAEVETIAPLQLKS